MAMSTLHQYDTARKPIRKQLRAIQRELIPVKSILASYGRQDTNVVVRQQQAFVKPCGAPGCKGFLSTAWKCGMCDLWSCPDCHDVKGESRDVEHTCDPNKVLTVQLLEKEAKGCPKCGVQICKIEGCDQMWCTHCNTGFHWRTGKIASGPIHNPHYFEWLRSQGQTPTVTQAHGGDCDYVTDRAVTSAILSGSNRNGQNGWLSYKEDHNGYLLAVWQLMREHQARARTIRDTDETFRQLRVRYMSNEIEEADWKIALQRYEKDAHFLLANHQIRDVFVNASRDLIRQILEPGTDRAVLRKQVEDLLTYCNTSAETVSKRFNRKAHTYTVYILQGNTRIAADSVPVAPIRS